MEGNANDRPGTVGEMLTARERERTRVLEIGVDRAAAQVMAMLEQPNGTDPLAYFAEALPVADALVAEDRDEDARFLMLAVAKAAPAATTTETVTVASAVSEAHHAYIVGKAVGTIRAGLLAALQTPEDAAGLLEPDWDAPVPEPIIWRDVGHKKDFRQPLAGAGDVLTMGGPGEVGKSSVWLAVAHQMGRPNGGNACGLRVRSGRVAYCLYEGLGGLTNRLRWFGGRGEWQHFRAFASPQPLWVTEDRTSSGPSEWWPVFWRGLAAFEPSVVVIDPVSVAFHANDDAGNVRAFVLRLTEEAERIGCAVVLVCHDTKSNRELARTGEIVGPGGVQGSSQWTDGPRAWLHLGLYRRGTNTVRLLYCGGANSAPSQWGAVLRDHWNGENWRGFRLEKRWQYAPAKLRAALSAEK